jgi:hypothetical protein
LPIVLVSIRERAMRVKKQKKQLEPRDSKAGKPLVIEASAVHAAGDVTSGDVSTTGASGSDASKTDASRSDAPRSDAPRADVSMSSARRADVSMSNAPRTAALAGEAPAVAEATSLSAFAVRCQQMYQAARTKRADGCIQLDSERLARALADTGIGSRAEQALYSLALLAAADGDLTLFQDDVIAALQKAS